MQSGYPMRVQDDRALGRYVDVTHENRLERDVDELLGGLTEEELDLVVRINHVVAAFTEKIYGRKLFATGSLIRAINVLRHIQGLNPGRKLTVLEIGPGTGYLGGLLLLRGHNYVATDVTQAMYIYQNHLWNHLAPGKVHDLATVDAKIAGLLSGNGPCAVHIPYWKYLALFDEETPPFRVDLVTANHVLCEMPEYGRAYTIRLARRLVSTEPGAHVFVFEGWGYPTVHPVHVWGQFRAAGLEIRHNDDRTTVVSVAQGVREPGPLSRLRLRVGMKAQRILRRPASLPDALVVRDAKLTTQIRDIRRSCAAEAKYNSVSVTSALKRELDVPSLASPDEKFARFVGLTL